MPQLFKDIKLAALLSTIERYKEEGWRFANLCGSTLDEGVELLYSFVRGNELENVRLAITNEDSVPSISALYPNAFVFENETHDLYGVAITNISIDYKGTFYPTSVPTPMNPASEAAQAYKVSKEDSCG